MPVCKNDSRRYYTEKEPSPKGKGYCAHAEKVGCRKRGRDNRMWVVTKVANTKRWIPVKRPTKPKKSTKKRKSRTSKRKKLRGGVKEKWWGHIDNIHHNKDLQEALINYKKRGWTAKQIIDEHYRRIRNALDTLKDLDDNNEVDRDTKKVLLDGIEFSLLVQLYAGTSPVSEKPKPKSWFHKLFKGTPKKP